MIKKIIITSISTIIVIIIVLLVFIYFYKPVFFYSLFNVCGIEIDQYTDGLPDFKYRAEKAITEYKLNPSKDSVFIINYQPSFHPECVVEITPDSIFVTRLHRTWDSIKEGSITRFTSRITNKDLIKFKFNEISKKPIFYNLKKIVNNNMKCMAYNICDGANIVVERHMGDNFNMFEFPAIHYHDKRYNDIQNILSHILIKSGFVPKTEIIDYGINFINTIEFNL